MKKAFLLAALLFCSRGAQAQMAEVLRSEFHKEKELGFKIVADDSLATLDALLKDPDLKIICFQAAPEKLTAPMATKLIEWVRAGHSLWVYEAGTARWFGFDTVSMARNQFNGKPEKGTLGDRGLEGVATVGVNYGTHEVLSGVGQVTLFLPHDQEEKYGAVLVKGDTIPLLRWTLESPALAALRREGRGLIAFKPLVWPEALSGDRFQANILEYSAGFGVPGPAGEGRLGKPPGPKADFVIGQPAVPLAAAPTPDPGTAANATAPRPPRPAADNNTPGTDTLTLSGEDPLVGRLVTPELRFETGNESLTLTRETLLSLRLGGATGLDELKTRDGHTHKGLLVTTKLEIEIQGGERRTISKKKLTRIEIPNP